MASRASIIALWAYYLQFDGLSLLVLLSTSDFSLFSAFTTKQISNVKPCWFTIAWKREGEKSKFQLLRMKYVDMYEFEFSAFIPVSVINGLPNDGILSLHPWHWRWKPWFAIYFEDIFLRVLHTWIVFTDLNCRILFFHDNLIFRVSSASTHMVLCVRTTLSAIYFIYGWMSHAYSKYTYFVAMHGLTTAQSRLPANGIVEKLFLCTRCASFEVKPNEAYSCSCLPFADALNATRIMHIQANNCTLPLISDLIDRYISGIIFIIYDRSWGGWGSGYGIANSRLAQPMHCTRQDDDAEDIQPYLYAYRDGLHRLCK